MDERLFREIWDKALDDTWGKPEFAALMIDQKAVKMFDEAVIMAFHAYTRCFQVNRNDVLEEAAAVADKKEKDATTLQGWNVHTVGIKDGAELASKMIAEQIRELKG